MTQPQQQGRVAAQPDAPTVSVVVPTFNRAGLLAETVGAILAQTYTDFELIIVDNMSADGTEAFVAGLDDPRIRYFRNPNNGVIAVNRNFGIRQARGRYVALCDDDDLWLPEKLEKQIRVLAASPGLALCYTNASTFGSGGEIDAWMMKKVSTKFYRNLLIGNFIPNSTVVASRDLIAQLGYLDIRPEAIAVEDYLMWLSIARNHALYYLDEPLIKYRVHGAANSGNLALMAERTFRVCLAEFKAAPRPSLFHFYALCRSFLRMKIRRLRS